MTSSAGYEPERKPSSGGYEVREVVNGGEPLIVMTDSSGRVCEHVGGLCEAVSRWYVERCPLSDESYLPPVRYVCSRHVVSAFNELLEARRERRQTT